MFFACGGTLQLFITGASFSSYGGATASGRGTVTYQGCSAACAPSRRHEPAMFTLSKIVRCSDGRLYYSQAVASAPGVPSEPANIAPFASSAVPLNCAKYTPGTGGSTVPTGPKLAETLGRTLVLKLVGGAVSYALPGGRLVALHGSVVVPDDTNIDALDGSVTLTAATGGSPSQLSALVYGGWFIVRQDPAAPYQTHFQLSQPLSGCRAGTARAAAAPQLRGRGTNPGRPTRRRLWVKESGGSWGTTGRYVVAAVEGTQWLTLDSCGLSNVTVAQGTVTVHDLVSGQTVVVHAHHGYQARHREAPAGPLAVVSSYWTAIGAQQFATAYDYLSPGAIGMSLAEFVATEKDNGVESAAFSGRLTAQSASSATVGVTSLVTRDHKFGCQRWTGSYGLVHGASGWLISRAAVMAKSCDA